MTEHLPLAKIKAADALDEQFRTVYRNREQSSLTLAVLALQIHDAEHWRCMTRDDGHIGYQSFQAWVESASSWTREHTYGRMRTVRELEKSIPIKELEGVSWTNCRVLQQLPESKRRQYLERAKEMTETEFRAVVVETPEGGMVAAEEKKTRITIWVERSFLLGPWTEALHAAESAMPGASLSTWLEYIIMDWLNGNQNPQGRPDHQDGEGLQHPATDEMGKRQGPVFD